MASSTRHLFPNAATLDRVRGAMLHDSALEFWMEEMYWWLMDLKLRDKMMTANDNEQDDGDV